MTDDLLRGKVRAMKRLLKFSRRDLMQGGGVLAASGLPGLHADPLAGLDARERRLVRETIEAYPELSPAEAREVLEAFGGI